MKQPSLRYLVSCAALLLAACQPAAEAPSPAARPRVEIPGLDLALAELPEPFAVEVNQGESFRLSAPGATLVIELGPVERAGINLIDAVRERKAAFESAAGGQYFGNRELMTPNGTAFTARGAYDSEAGPVEETWVYGLHPTANRLMTVVYTYSPGESGERVQHLMAVLGEIEALTPPAAEGAAR